MVFTELDGCEVDLYVECWTVFSDCQQKKKQSPQQGKRAGQQCVKIELGLIKIENDGWIEQLAGP